MARKKKTENTEAIISSEENGKKEKQEEENISSMDRFLKPSKPMKEKQEKEPKKKKKNPISNTYNINSDEFIHPMPENEHIIMQLNLKPDPEDKGISMYELYSGQKNQKNNPDMHTFCDDTHEETVKPFKEEESYPAQLEDDFSELQEYQMSKILKDFQDVHEEKEWPTSTNIACYWCCHKFFNEPVGIPLRYDENTGKFDVMGCYCSLECAQAQNLSMKDDIDETWERSNLINFLCRKLNYNSQGFVKPAPSRLTLKMFGGPFTIEEFRNYGKKDKLIYMNFPPMVKVSQQIEEINQSEVNSNYKYIPIDMERINNYKEKMRLKRTKPLHDKQNTLDNAMNIKIYSPQKNQDNEEK